MDTCLFSHDLSLYPSNRSLIIIYTSQALRRGPNEVRTFGGHLEQWSSFVLQNLGWGPWESRKGVPQGKMSCSPWHFDSNRKTEVKLTEERRGQVSFFPSPHGSLRLGALYKLRNFLNFTLSSRICSLSLTKSSSFSDRPLLYLLSSSPTGNQCRLCRSKRERQKELLLSSQTLDDHKESICFVL